MGGSAKTSVHNSWLAVVAFKTLVHYKYRALVGKRMYYHNSSWQRWYHHLLLPPLGTTDVSKEIE